MLGGEAFTHHHSETTAVTFEILKQTYSEPTRLFSWCSGAYVNFHQGPLFHLSVVAL